VGKRGGGGNFSLNEFSPGEGKGKRPKRKASCPVFRWDSSEEGRRQKRLANGGAKPDGTEREDEGGVLLTGYPEGVRAKGKRLT